MKGLDWWRSSPGRGSGREQTLVRNHVQCGGVLTVVERRKGIGLRGLGLVGHWQDWHSRQLTGELSGFLPEGCVI